MSKVLDKLESYVNHDLLKYWQSPETTILCKESLLTEAQELLPSDTWLSEGTPIQSTKWANLSELNINEHINTDVAANVQRQFIVIFNQSMGIIALLREKGVAQTSIRSFSEIEFLIAARYKAFKKHEQSIQAAYDLLDDDQSRTTFFAILKTRLTLDSLNPDFGEIQKVRVDGTEYLDTSLMSFSNQEVYADCGAFTGDTAARFIRFTKGQFKHIFLFEPDLDNFQSIQAQLRQRFFYLNTPSGAIDCISIPKGPTVTPYNVGVSDQNEQVKFYADLGEASHYEHTYKMDITSANPVVARNIRLDDALKGQPISYIKFDVEGYEMKALAGAKTLIQANTPKLCVCVYHKPSHLWSIINYIQEVNPNYHFALRQYNYNLWDTILYAMPNS